MECLRKTREALKEIQKQLLPFLRDLGVDSCDSGVEKEEPAKPLSTANNEKVIQASMAVALAMGTLRYMGARLRGLDQGRKSDDPLRQELNNMRKRMVTLQKKLDASKKKAIKADETMKRKNDDKQDTKETSPEPATKRRKGV